MPKFKIIPEMTEPLKRNQVSIPLVITNKMRIKLSGFGYTDKEISNMTPQQCWELINK